MNGMNPKSGGGVTLCGSDLRNLKRLLTVTGAIPKGLFLDEAISVARDELGRECDYTLELANQQRFGTMLAGDANFVVPRVYPELSSRGVLTSQFVTGVAADKLFNADEATRNRVAELLLQITMRELFEFRFMQTDPNFSNFMYDPRDGALRLLDFGAARSFRKSFVDNYLRLVIACAQRDRRAVIEHSHALGFLTGVEDRVMLDAHVNAAFVVGEPFAGSAPFDFRAANITRRVAEFGRVMMDRRLAAPPVEAYSLHRRLSGAFMMCVKLGAVVRSHTVLERIVAQYRYGPEEGQALTP
jgi:aarF domain-containing kinase